MRRQRRPLTSSLATLFAGALVAAAGLVGLTGLIAGPASAAVCDGSGISVVVDSNDGAGGGTRTYCVKDGAGKTATQIFTAAGITLGRGQSQSICQVDGRPADATCQGLGKTYWSLWVSDGKGGWKYADNGADQLVVPADTAIAWAWQGPSGERKPDVSSTADGHTGSADKAAKSGATKAAAKDTGSEVPVWLPPVAVVVVLAAGAGAYVLKTRRRTSSR